MSNADAVSEILSSARLLGLLRDAEPVREALLILQIAEEDGFDVGTAVEIARQRLVERSSGFMASVA